MAGVSMTCRYALPMAMVHRQKQHPLPARQPVSAPAQEACETAAHRARLRRYAHAGGLRGFFNVMVDAIDLALSAAGYIDRHPALSLPEGIVAFAITQAGEVKLFEWSQ